MWVALWDFSRKPTCMCACTHVSLQCLTLSDWCVCMFRPLGDVHACDWAQGMHVLSSFIRSYDVQMGISNRQPLDVHSELYTPGLQPSTPASSIPVYFGFTSCQPAFKVLFMALFRLPQLPASPPPPALCLPISAWGSGCGGVGVRER